MLRLRVLQPSLCLGLDNRRREGLLLGFSPGRHNLAPRLPGLLRDRHGGAHLPEGSLEVLLRLLHLVALHRPGLRLLEGLGQGHAGLCESLRAGEQRLARSLHSRLELGEGLLGTLLLLLLVLQRDLCSLPGSGGLRICLLSVLLPQPGLGRLRLRIAGLGLHELRLRRVKLHLPQGGSIMACSELLGGLHCLPQAVRGSIHGAVLGSAARLVKGGEVAFNLRQHLQDRLFIPPRAVQGVVDAARGDLRHLEHIVLRLLLAQELLLGPGAVARGLVQPLLGRGLGPSGLRGFLARLLEDLLGLAALLPELLGESDGLLQVAGHLLAVGLSGLLGLLHPLELLVGRAQALLRLGDLRLAVLVLLLVLVLRDTAVES
mmetsp:Transcript_9811/g.29349  ORF Transcript_9811/g.29349 Transcript_9811/m.29349 type:complete len:375 (-) Transcript_9811:717-1841(-)